MRILDWLEKKFYRFSIPHITLVLIFGQIIFFCLNYLKLLPLENVVLIGNRVLAGEYWRLATFLFIPIPQNILFAVFVWYLYYLYGTALENSWGIFKYNIYIFLSYILTILISFIIPGAYITNAYIYITIFLAFAYLFPDFILYIFFVIPVKVKWLALIIWISYIFILIFGNWISRFLLLVSCGNFLIFFGKDIILRVRYGKRRMIHEISKIKEKNTPFHKCYICGITDIDDPDMVFRYCSDCDECFCAVHLDNHKCAK